MVARMAEPSSTAARPAPVESPRSRRTQEQRSAETQTKLMDATIECLLEYGYAGTTTPLVVKRAGVTRGALLHHYPSREDLVAAAVRYLAVKRVQEALETFGRLTLTEAVVPQALDLLWRMHQGPLFTAVIELWVAARTDESLAAQVESVEQVVLTSLASASVSLVPAGVPPSVVKDLVLTAMDGIRGVLIGCYSSRDPQRAQRHWERLRRHLLRLAEIELAGTRPQARSGAAEAD
ncbi:TetR/AcrR family transcriptional regulator [Nocardia iowensis]